MCFGSNRIRASMGLLVVVESGFYLSYKYDVISVRRGDLNYELSIDILSILFRLVTSVLVRKFFSSL